MSFIDFFIATTTVAALNFIWFNTHVFYEYCKLFGLGRYFKKFEEQPPEITFPQYLFIKKNEISKNSSVVLFFVKLVSCPLCLSFWLTVIICNCLTISILLILPVYIASVFLYGVLANIVYK
jgi:hypothetical protein